MNTDRQTPFKEFIAEVQVKDEVESAEDNEDEQYKF